MYPPTLSTVCNGANETSTELRLNLGDQYLAYRFGVHNSTISRYFKKWINVMYVRLKPLIKWPGRGELLKSMPVIYRKNFKACVIIIDCFEVLPGDLILADRGFTIQESAGMYCAQVKVPPFTKGKGN